VTINAKQVKSVTPVNAISLVQAHKPNAASNVSICKTTALIAAHATMLVKPDKNVVLDNVSISKAIANIAENVAISVHPSKIAKRGFAVGDLGHTV
jgi:hypothetical protein